MFRSTWSGLVLGAMVATLADGPCHAQPTDTQPKSTLPASPLGFTRYARERWGVVGLGATNPGDQPVEVLSSLYFSGDPGRQFARQLWIPPRTRRYSWYPVLPPSTMSLDKSTVAVKSLLVDRSGGREVLLKNPGGQMAYDGLLPVQQDVQGSGVIFDNDDETITAFMHGRFARLRSWHIVRMHGDYLPPTRESMQGLDHLLLGSNRPVADAAGITALRRWLYGGGHLWIALDRVDLATVALVLGEALPCHVVDRVALTEWKIFDTGIRGQERARAEPVQNIGDFDRPVDMVRVEAPGMRVTHTVNGWPAALWLPAGRGTVLFTTLGGRGWIRPRQKGDPPAPEPHHSAAKFSATHSLQTLSYEFFGRDELPALEPHDWDAFVSEQVGYSIVGRGPVAGVLAAFCVGLLAVGIGLARTNRLAYLGWVGPAGALLTAIILVGIGHASRHGVPATVAAGQFVEVAPRVAELHVSGLLGIYNQQESREPLGAQDGGIFLPDPAGPNSGATQRMVWTDLDKWHWENVSLPAGLHRIPFEYATKVNPPIAARVTFGPEGVNGVWTSGPLENAADALIAMPGQRNLAVRLGTAGTFTAGSDDLLAPGQFLAASVLSDEQRRRRSIYQKLLADPKRRYPSQPMFLTWTAPLDTHFTLPKDARRTGSALVAVPLEFHRPAPGTHMRIPSPFLPLRPALIADALSGWYNVTHGTWIGPRLEPGQTMLRFQLPPETYPLRLERVTLSVTVSAPARTVTITTLVNDKIVPLAVRDGPVGTIRVELAPDALRLDAKGGLFLGIKIGNCSPPQDWVINDVQLEIEGEAIEP